MEKFKKYTRRKVEDFSQWKCNFQVFGRFISAKTFFKLFYKIKYVGRENIDWNRKFIICPNHISFFDPFLAGEVLRRPIAFMGKKNFLKMIYSPGYLIKLVALPSIVKNSKFLR